REDVQVRAVGVRVARLLLEVEDRADVVVSEVFVRAARIEIVRHFGAAQRAAGGSQREAAGRELPVLEVEEPSELELGLADALRERLRPVDTAALGEL